MAGGTGRGGERAAVVMVVEGWGFGGVGGGANICRARYPHAARGISCEELSGCLIHKRCHPCKPPDFIMTNSWWFN